MIVISSNNLEKIHKHAREAYPFECCGILVGLLADKKEVKEVRGVENINKERGHDRYEIAPHELYRIDKDSSKNGLKVIGFYHSHPDHPPEPSAFDSERAWQSYSYIIVSISNPKKDRPPPFHIREGSKGEDLITKSWVLDEEDKSFKEEPLEVRGNV